MAAGRVPAPSPHSDARRQIEQPAPPSTERSPLSALKPTEIRDHGSTLSKDGAESRYGSDKPTSESAYGEPKGPQRGKWEGRGTPSVRLRTPKALEERPTGAIQRGMWGTKKNESVQMGNERDFVQPGSDPLRAAGARTSRPTPGAKRVLFLPPSSTSLPVDVCFFNPFSIPLMELRYSRPTRASRPSSGNRQVPGREACGTGRGEEGYALGKGEVPTGRWAVPNREKRGTVNSIPRCRGSGGKD